MKFNAKTFLKTFCILWIATLMVSHSVYAQDYQAQAPTWVEREVVASVIAVDLIPGLEKLYLLDPLKQPLGEFKMRALMYGRPFTCTSFDGMLYFGIADGIDANGKPKYKPVATASVPVQIGRLSLIFVPSDVLTGRSDGQIHYQVQVFDSSLEAFPLASTHVINLLPTQMVLKIGEEKRAVPGGQSILIDDVSSLDSFNMADVSFFYRAGEKWNILKQSKIRYLPSIRYTAVAYFNTRVRKPTIVFVRDGGRMQ